MKTERFCGKQIAIISYVYKHPYMNEFVSSVLILFGLSISQSDEDIERILDVLMLVGYKSAAVAFAKPNP